MTKAKKPLLSIIMPAYNAERYIEEAIDSILRQTYKNFELIIINDGSSDGTWSIIEQYAKHDTRIIAKTQKNKGVVDTANYAASLASGEYISRHDADDVSFTTKFQDWIDTITKFPGAVLVTGSIEVINERGEFAYRDYVPTTDDDIKRSLHLRNPIPNGATLINRKVFEEVGRYSNVFAEDCDLWVKLYTKGQFVGTGTFLYKWRTNFSGLTFTNLEESSRKEKEYVGRIWDIENPHYMSRVDIMNHSGALLNISSERGVGYKVMFLHDLARVAIHLIKRGERRQGIMQLFAIASTGRTGLRTVAQRIILSTKGAVARRPV